MKKPTIKEILWQVLQNQGAMMLAMEMDLEKYKPNLIQRLNKGGLNTAVANTIKLISKMPKNKRT